MQLLRLGLEAIFRYWIFGARIDFRVKSTPLTTKPTSNTLECRERERESGHACVCKVFI